MNVPRPITTVPQSRRYKRRFKSVQAKTFYEGDEVVIEIPPVDRGYLTKNQKLHFDVNVKWTSMSEKTATTMLYDMVSEASAQTYLTGYPNPGPGLSIENNARMLPYVTKFASNDPINAYFQVTPSMDINGTYGFLESIRVLDFLGTTVLEDVPNHHGLTSQFADVWLKHENMDPYRPRVVDSSTGFVRKASAVSLDGVSFPYQVTDPLPLNITCSVNGITAKPYADEMTAYVSLDLYSMLHKFSLCFVPLHNGFSIRLKFRNCLTFETIQKDRKIVYERFNTGLHGEFGFVTADPTLQSLTFSNVYLEADILELTPQLDQQVDKIVHYQGWKYQQDVLPPMEGKRAIFTSRLYPELKSVNRVYIGQRQLVTSYPSIRVRNNLTEAVLQYNKAEVNSSLTLEEFISAWSREEPDEYLNSSDFITNFDLTGPRLYVGSLLLSRGATSMGVLYAGQSGTNAYNVLTNTYADWDYTNTGLSEQGRFLVILDSKIPSSGEGVVAGIDTTRHALEYQLTYGTATTNNVALDCFLLHDAVVTVDPGNSTTVSF